MIRLVLLIAALLAPALLAQELAPEIERALAFARQIENKVFRAMIAPHWLPDGHRLWYRVQTGPGVSEYVLADAESGTIMRAPTAAALGLPVKRLTTSADTTTGIRASSRTGEETSVRFSNAGAEAVELFWIDPQAQRKSYGKLEPAATREVHTFAGHVWLVATAGGAALGVIEAAPEPLELTIDGPGREAKRETPGEVSPDGRWSVRFEKQQVVLCDTTTDESTVLTTDGTVVQPYRGPVRWAPDAQSFTVLSVKDVPVRQVTVVEARPEGQTQPKVHTFDYAKPGDALPRPRPVLFRLTDRRPLPIDDALFPNPFTPGSTLDLRWSPRSDEFYFDYNQRGHQLWRILAVNAQAGGVRTVVEEKADTFIDYTHKTWRHWLDDTHELLWMSERDGWAHLWLYDTAAGAVKNQVTHGAWVVREVVWVDEEKRQVWFLASGLRAGEDPYHRHLCRVNFDGSGFLRLTEGDGDHDILFSPDARFFTDRWSRADQPPVAELRRSDDGRLVCELERADARALLATGWTMPERFVAKGRDGATDIHGVLIRPSHFDPAKKYPVLEEVYAGPHGAFAPKRFDPLARLHALAELGIIVVKADGLGTNHRGKAFQDVAWKNLQDAGFPDRIAWIKAAAATRPWMDLTRVGIFGGSAGGQNAMRALLDHADFYQAAFADCGCHDNRMDKLWWNEQWLGWPVDDSYVRASNVVDAPKLRGALMLCVGELDHNVDPASTMQVAAALEKANKPFELLVITGAGHGAAETPYGNRRRLEFFARHLLAPPAK
ncbi:MAG TPA: prolyl oligopeptidase family serine peptidase [Chthoniobacteraceae bacterium]|jgi:dipeptidyl aminopeptidase/acylaminoacyl peptidase|nr:prolyl oligopeptidase family serine peptidase [Chthoniobacteraceae bacterium]